MFRQTGRKRGIWFMHYIDMHCDTLMVSLFKDQKQDINHSEYSMVDFERLAKAGAMAQFFAAWLPPQRTYVRYGVPLMTDDAYIEACHNILIKNVEKHSDKIAMAYTAEDIEKNRAAGKMSAVFTIEDGRSVEASFDQLKHYHDDLGVRAMTLTWNFYNCFGAPNSADPLIMYDGLSSFGKAAVPYMQELGILVDVSHLSEGGFWDVYNLAKKPFVATHSNCRALTPHQRNLTDDQLRALADKGGVTGINFAPEFLGADGKGKDSTIADMVRHLRHMVDVAGSDVIAIGTDFDGIHGNLEIGSCDQMGLLEEALADAGFTGEQIEKFAYRNVLRVMKDTIR